MSKALTINALIDAYRSDEVSPYQELRYRTRENYDSLMRRVGEDHGATKIADIKFRTLKEWHKKWLPRGVPMAHSLMGMVRTLVGYGMTYLEMMSARASARSYTNRALKWASRASYT
jgi:hypothetical protein